jgi:hypothetical protein
MRTTSSALELIDRHGDVETLRIIASVFETRGMLVRTVTSKELSAGRAGRGNFPAGKRPWPPVFELAARASAPRKP